MQRLIYKYFYILISAQNINKSSLIEQLPNIFMLCSFMHIRVLCI